MQQKAWFVLLTLLVGGLVMTVPSFACTATCTGGSCSGNMSCSCGTDGTPHCSDYQVIKGQVLATPAGLEAYSSYLGSIDSPQARSLQQAADDMEVALYNNDLQGYLAAHARHEAILKTVGPEIWSALAAGGFLKETEPTAFDQ